jgi:hypothetical protein
LVDDDFGRNGKPLRDRVKRRPVISANSAVEPTYFQSSAFEGFAARQWMLELSGMRFAKFVAMQARAAIRPACITRGLRSMPAPRPNS